MKRWKCNTIMVKGESWADSKATYERHVCPNCGNITVLRREKKK